MVTDPPGTPVTPGLYIYIYDEKVKRSFTSIQTFHTHTPCTKQGVFSPNEVKMRMTRDEGEMSMKMR